MKNLPKDFERYLEPFDGDAKDRFLNIRNLVLELYPKVEERLSYQMPSFFAKKVLLHVGLFKSHLSLFPGPKTIEFFKNRLSQYSLDKGTIRIFYDQALDLDLIKDIFLYNLENRK